MHSNSYNTIYGLDSRTRSGKVYTVQQNCIIRQHIFAHFLPVFFNHGASSSNSSIHYSFPQQTDALQHAVV